MVPTHGPYAAVLLSSAMESSCRPRLQSQWTCSGKLRMAGRATTLGTPGLVAARRRRAGRTGRLPRVRPGVACRALVLPRGAVFSFGKAAPSRSRFSSLFILSFSVSARFSRLRVAGRALAGDVDSAAVIFASASFFLRFSSM